MASAELLLHPVRLRVVQAFLGDRALTTSDLRAELPDVPPATLYRHVGALAEGGVLEVAEERRVRGTVERTYRLPAGAGSIGPQEAATMSAEQHRQGFLAFVAGLLADFDRYLERDDVDLARDLVGYRQAAMYLSDDELRELIAELGTVLASRTANGPGEGRTRRIFSTILMPGE
ncbi:helix-turn-helix domain-containing protein [Pseudonocardia bannensis]|uniref:Helix-turn-helix domain-containing protein n=1 Tax=Pseudonocardia bannensis TaxID=630973 RepID=A0A848DQM1_9PSEU|nr:helix-turn-helix domain-containing protein [Pseudonocardia bannensis]NMH95018.1 helix-turn-helix domain-containing protein [Pseudonocardia bannensis]